MRYRGEGWAYFRAALREFVDEMQKELDKQQQMKYTHTTMNTAQLAEESVQELVDKGLSFSLHDVVRHMRNVANEKDVVVDDQVLGFIPEVGRVVSEIPYDTYVKNKVLAAVRSQKNLDETVDPQGGFRVFSPQPKMGIFSTPGGNAVNHPTTVVQQAANPIGGGSVDDQIKNFVGRHSPVTVKQIQSALKRGRGYTSVPGKEIRSRAKSLGFKVDEDSPNNKALVSL